MKTFRTIVRSLVPERIIGWYHFALAFCGALRYWFPSKKLIVIGVTGTDGKSTTVEMITRVLREAGLRVASTSSVRFQINDRIWPNTKKMGMPGRFFLQKFLRDALRAGCTHAVIEVSSEGILQHRHRFVAFHTAVLTNVYPEHIERHGSFDRYLATKARLLTAAEHTHILNGDDKNTQAMLGIHAERKFLFGMQPRHVPDGVTTIWATDVRELKTGTVFRAEGMEFAIGLLGRINVYNALAALCVARAQRIPLEACQRAFAGMSAMPGRMELAQSEPFGVLIDYAVTPNALGNLYATAKRIFAPRKMICVFGACGGGRDRWKRTVLGEIAANACDRIVLTNEDPYEEDPAQILSQIEEGISRARFPESNLYKILDRKEAIQQAIALAEAGDLVVLSGKGSEDSIAVAGGKKIPWNERAVALDLLRARNGTRQAS